MAFKYKKPRSINAVSIMMMLFLGATVYVAIYAWPVYSLSSRAKGVLLDNIPVLWRANLVGEAASLSMINGLKKNVPIALRKAGVKDPNLKVVFSRNKQEVSIEAQFTASAFFPVINKTVNFNLSPKAVTDAARVEW
jgi:hypothetical protein